MPLRPNQPGTLAHVLWPIGESEAGPGRQSGHLIFNAHDGRKCAVFASLATPPGPGRHPLIVHAPGGGQTIAIDDLNFWVERGFACAAFDWQAGLFDHDPRRKSVWPSGVVAQNESAMNVAQVILPLAAQAVGAVIDWASADPRIDASRIGMTGISWGGYLTWIANAVEPRIKAAVPVYGCGGLFRPEHPCMPPVSDPVAKVWASEWDPLALADRQVSPVCWLSAGNDFFGWPWHADELLDSLSQPHCRTYQPNLDHAVTAEDAATAVAWMQHYLMTGPPIPAEPLFGPHGIEADRAGDVESIETWWTASIDLDETACWIPGQAPPSARARFGRIRYRCGVSLNTAIQICAKASATPERIGDRWPDARGGLGACSMGATQLHNNRVTVTGDPNDPSRARIVQHRKGAPVGFHLRQFADPRFNHPGFAGVRVRLGELKTPLEQVNVCLKYRPAENRRLRTEVRGPVRVERGSTIELSRRSMQFVPPDVSWDQVVSVWIDGIRDGEFVVGPIDRILDPA